jgi:hypothetical protein
MTPAEELQQAAKLMRERAGGCQQRAWYWEPLGEKRYPQRVSSEGNCAIIAETFIDPAHRPYEAEHIASWSPPVALAVASWLEQEAGNARSAFHHIDGSWEMPQYGAVSSALTVARAYLGKAARAAV